jgi:hypothetical protein
MSRSKYRPQPNLSTSPRWFRNIMSNVPLRREAKAILHRVVHGEEIEVVLRQPNRVRPYYW